MTANRRYLIALAVLVPAAILAAMSSDWFRYQEFLRGEPIAAVAATPVEYAGGEFTLLEWHSFDSSTQAGQAASLLEGTELVTATFAVVPPSDGFFCETSLVAADGREWREASFSDADFEIASDAEGYCLSDSVDPFTLQVYYVTPKGAVDGATLRISVSSEAPAFLAFAL